TRTNNNYQRAEGAQLRDYDIRFEQRELVANQIRGRHVVGADTRDLVSLLDRDLFGGMTFEWYASEATAETDIPSELKLTAEDAIAPTTGEVLQPAIRRSTAAADYRFTFLADRVRSSGWDVMKPLSFAGVDVEISGGQDIFDKARSYAQTQFGL